ncbi:MAG: GNAT family N-acetyltransferase [Solirubrobacterales bacterium]
MKVRPASAADAAAIVPLLAELGYPTATETVRARLERIAGGEATGVLLAEVDDAPAALIAYQLIEHLERPAPTCRITALVTAPRHRRRGVAARLLGAVEELARGRGCDRLEVTTRPRREDALAFYLGAGFAERPRRLVRSLA